MNLIPRVLRIDYEKNEIIAGLPSLGGTYHYESTITIKITKESYPYIQRGNQIGRYYSLESYEEWDKKVKKEMIAELAKGMTEEEIVSCLYEKDK